MKGKSGKLDALIQDRITFRLSRLNARLNAQASRILGKRFGISLTQWRVLVMVRALGQPTLTEMARDSHLDKGQLSRSIRGMVVGGLVMASERTESDHRMTRLRLTQEGERLYEKAWPAMRSRQEALLGAMDESERRTVFDVLDRLDRIAEVRDEL